MSKKLTEICTCDDFCDEPCPRHKRENQLQDAVIRLRYSLEEVLREVDFEFGGWGDMSVLAEDEPDHYAVKAMNLLYEMNATPGGTEVRRSAKSLVETDKEKTDE